MMSKITNRTEVAMLRAKGPWKVVDADTKRTDCDAKEMGPSLCRAVNKELLVVCSPAYLHARC
jgi:hypothetical protein